MSWLALGVSWGYMGLSVGHMSSICHPIISSTELIQEYFFDCNPVTCPPQEMCVSSCHMCVILSHVCHPVTCPPQEMCVSSCHMCVILSHVCHPVTCVSSCHMCVILSHVCHPVTCVSSCHMSSTGNVCVILFVNRKRSYCKALNLGNETV